MVLDRPGSLGVFAGILGRHGVSLSAVSQRDARQEGGHVPVVVLTHAAAEAAVDAALAEIEAAGVVGERPRKLRILD
jgi:homoserine dehydrogenase